MTDRIIHARHRREMAGSGANTNAVRLPTPPHTHIRGSLVFAGA